MSANYYQSSSNKSSMFDRPAFFDTNAMSVAREMAKQMTTPDENFSFGAVGMSTYSCGYSPACISCAGVESSSKRGMGSFSPF